MSRKAPTDHYARRSRKADPSTPSQKKLREKKRQIDSDRRKAILARTAAGRAAITAFIGKTKRTSKLPVMIVVAKPPLPPPVEVVPLPPPIAPPVTFSIFEYEKNLPKRVLPPISQRPSSVSRAPVRERVPVKVPMALKMMDAQLRQQEAPPPITVETVPSEPSKEKAAVKKSKPVRTTIVAPVDRVTVEVRKRYLDTCAYCNGVGHVHTNCPKKVALRKALTSARFRRRAETSA